MPCCPPQRAVLGAGGQDAFEVGGGPVGVQAQRRRQSWPNGTDRQGRIRGGADVRVEDLHHCRDITAAGAPLGTESVKDRRAQCLRPDRVERRQVGLVVAAVVLGVGGAWVSRSVHAADDRPQDRFDVGRDAVWVGVMFRLDQSQLDYSCASLEWSIGCLRIVL